MPAIVKAETRGIMDDTNTDKPIDEPIETPPTSKPEPKIDPNAYHAALRIADKYKTAEAERKKAEAAQAKAAKETELANQGKLKEIQDMHKAELEAKESAYEKQLTDMHNRAKLSKHFPDVVTDGLMTKLEGVEDVDAAIQSFIESDEYAQFAHGAQTKTTTKQAPNIPASAGVSGVGRESLDQLRQMVKTEKDPAKVSAAVQAIERMVLEGAEL